VKKHAVNTVGGTDRYDYNANGNVTIRDKGLSTQQALTWDHENRLASLTATGLSESYLYDADGQRVKKTSGGVATFYPFAHYEISGGMVTKYYFFAGQRVAMKVGTNPITYLNGDHLSSTALSTSNTGAYQVGQGYYGYGKYRTGGSLPTNYRYTGQELDIPTGLMYYGARYYDRTVGMFVSPDTLVPDPTNVYDYNRYMYVRGNPERQT
jgi:RHS repeat-associated protein